MLAPLAAPQLMLMLEVLAASVAKRPIGVASEAEHTGLETDQPDAVQEADADPVAPADEFVSDKAPPVLVAGTVAVQKLDAPQPRVVALQPGAGTSVRTAYITVAWSRDGEDV